MKPKLFLILMLAVLTVGCSSQSTVQPATPTSVSPTIAHTQPGELPVVTMTPVIVDATATVEIAAVDDKFRATDPTTVALASGKPKLIEFFAVW